MAASSASGADDDHDDDDFRCLDDIPQRRIGNELRGWVLALNRQPVDGTFSDAESAMAEAGSRCDYPLVWSKRATNPEGESYFMGGHPEIMALEEREGLTFLDSKVGIQAHDVATEQFRDHIGGKAWWDRWYVEPKYSPMFEKVVGAIRPLPHSTYYAAPYGQLQWGVWDEAADSLSPLRFCVSRSEAIQVSSRLALGLENPKEHRSDLYRTALIVTACLGLAAFLFSKLLGWFLR